MRSKQVRTIGWAVVAIVTWLLAACAPPSTESVSPLAALRSELPTPTADMVPLGAQGIVDRAVADLAARLGIEPGEISVADVEALDWPDSSLGCPEPGQAYLTVITPGYRITLRAGGAAYDYHADPDRVVQCQGGRPADSGKASGSDMEEQLVRAIRADLAWELGIGPEAITLVGVMPVQWPDASLGCPQPGQSYAQMITPGFQVVFEAGGRTYTYHASGSRYLRCEASQERPLPTETPVGGGGVEPAATVTPSAGPEPLPTETPSGDAVLDRLIRAAKSDLGRRLGIPAGEIRVREAGAVQWRDSSLGCPETGQAYLTVIVSGYRLRLEARGSIYEYHTDDQRVVFCKNPQPPVGE